MYRCQIALRRGWAQTPWDVCIEAVGFHNIQIRLDSESVHVPGQVLDGL